MQIVRNFTKVLANRIELLLPDLIPENQIGLIKQSCDVYTAVASLLFLLLVTHVNQANSNQAEARTLDEREKVDEI